MSYDPWLDGRNFPPNRLDQEAAQHAREAATTLPPDYVSGQLFEARRIGERQARERAGQLAAEAHAQREMQQRIASGQMGPHYSVPVSSPPLTEAQRAAAAKRQAADAERREQAAAEAARQRAVKAEQQKQAAAEAAKQRELRDQFTKRVEVLNRQRSTDLQLSPLLFGHAWLYVACTITFGLSMLLGMFTVSGSFDGGLIGMLVVVLALAIALPIAATYLELQFLYVWMAGSLPVLVSLLHWLDSGAWLARIVMLGFSVVIALIAGLMAAFIAEMCSLRGRRDQAALAKWPTCDYCQKRPSILVKHVPSKCGGGKITLVACSKHADGALWTEALERALLDANTQ